MAGTALGLQLHYELLKGQVLVGVRIECDFLHTLQQFREGWVAREIASENKRVDEEADQSLGFNLGAAGNWRTYEDVRLPRVAVQQKIECRKVRHEWSGIFPATQPL